MILLTHPLAARAASGTWNGTQDAMWTNSANWSVAPYAGYVLGETAVFDNAGNANTNLNLTGVYSLFNMTFTGSNVASYTVGTGAPNSQTLVMGTGGEYSLADTSANSQTFNCAIQLGGTTGDGTYTFRNSNPGQTLTLRKIFALSDAGAGTKTVNISGVGPLSILGDIQRGSCNIDLYDTSANVLALSGNASLRQLFLNGTNAVVNIGSGATVAFNNAGGANLVASQDATINGPGSIVLSTNTGDDHANNAAASGKTLTINARLTGTGGFEYYHGSYYGTIALNGANDFAGNTILNAPGTLQCSAIGDKGEAGNLGEGTNIILNAVGSRLLYTGAGETTDRILDVRNGGTFEHAGSGPLIFSAATASTSSGGKTLVVRNYAAATGEFSGSVQNGAGAVSLTKEGDGTWRLSAANTLSGALAVNGGTLLLTGAAGSLAAASSCTVSNGATLLLNNTAAANNTNRLANAATVALQGGVLRLANDAGDADFGESVGALTVWSGTNTVTVDQAANTRTAALRLASLACSGNGATVNFSGAGLGESDRCRIFIAGQGKGLIGSWATVNGAQPAFYDPASGVCAAPTWTVTNIAARGPDSVVPNDASADVLITEPGVSGAVPLAGGPTNSVARLTQCAATSSVIATASRTLCAYSIGIAATGQALTLGEGVGNGAITPLTPGGTLNLENGSASALTVNAALADNGSPASFAKNGAGDVIIAGPALHTGTTAINGGSLIFGGHDASQRVTSVITGSGALIKTGTNLLHLTAANTYTGPTTINQGLVRVTTNNAFGASASGTVISSGATLDVGGAPGVNLISLQPEPITVSGAGANGQGAIINSSPNDQWNATGNVTLDGDTTFGGSGRWDIRDGTFKMNDHALTKVGNAWFALSQTAVTPGGTNASIDVQAGTLRVQRNADFGGSAANTLHLRSGTIINFYDLWSYPAWRLICENSSRYHVEFGVTPPRNFWYGPVVLNGALALTSDGANIGGFAGAVSGIGSLVKSSAHTFSLTGTNNTYGGATTVSNGTLFAAAPGSLPGYNDGRVTVVGGATLAIQPGVGTAGWSAESVRDLNASAKFLSATAMLSIDTAPANLAIPHNLSGFMGLAKQGTNTLSLGGSNTNLGNITVYAGQLSLAGSNNQNSGTCYLEGSATSNALLRLAAGASLAGSGDFSVRNNGALYMEGGSFTRPTSDTLGERFAFGFNNGGYGYFMMSGGAVSSRRLILGAVNSTAAGYGGTGIARFTGGVAALSWYPHFGSTPASIAVLTIDTGGTFLKTGGETYVAYEGGRSELNLAGGLFDNAGANFRVGNTAGSASATGIVNLCAGRFANLQPNRYSGAFFLNFCGGTFAAGSSSPAELLSSSLTAVYAYGPVGSFAGGAVFDSTGRSVTVSSPIQAPPGQGVYSVSLTSQGSGYVGEPYVQIRGGGGDGATAVANLADDGTGRGTFKVSGVTVTCPGFGYTSAPAVAFLKGGAGAVSATGTVSLAQNVSGGLTKIGAGTLTLVATNTYTGATTVAAGTLKLGNARALATNSVIALAGGTLDLNGYTVTNAVSGTGQVTNGTVVTTLSPGGPGVVATNALTLANAAFSGTYLADVTASGSSDLVAIQGNIDLSNLALQLVDLGALNRQKGYTLLTCSGARTGAFKSATVPDPHWKVVYRTDGSVQLLFVSGTLLRVL